MKPMTKEEMIEMRYINYLCLYSEISSIVTITPDFPIEDYAEIKDQIICDYCFGETYMLKVKK